MNKKAANAVTGGLSHPSKMPGPAFNLPAIEACPTGAKLAQIEGTPCHICYCANRGRYAFPNVKDALTRRLNLLNKALETPHGKAEWVEAMATLI